MKEATVEGIPTELISGLSAPAILAIGVVALMFGKILPERTVNRIVEAKDAIIKEQADYIDTLKENNALLRRGNEAAVHVVQSIPEVAGVDTRD